MSEIKQVIVVRTDLDMGKGKIAAQVGHACVLGAEHVRKSNSVWFEQWWNGQEKVVVKVSSLKELEEVKRGAIELDIPWSEVTDAGTTISSSFNLANEADGLSNATAITLTFTDGSKLDLLKTISKIKFLTIEIIFFIIYCFLFKI